MREEQSFCRICSGTCGTIVTIDDDDRIASVRGDREHPLTAGYACSKGVDMAEMHNRADRILRPLKRTADGSFEEISLEQATAEIAERMGAIIDRDGPASIATFCGTASFWNTTLMKMLAPFMRAIGSPSMFTSLTIDCSSKVVTAVRMGNWAAGKQLWDESNVWLMFGTNPLVSITSIAGVPTLNINKRMKNAKSRGLKLIVVDPRRSETAAAADLFVQVRPGEDSALAAGILKVILDEGLHDAEFCDAYVDGLDDLRKALDPFTLDCVVARTGVPAEQIIEIARAFGGPGKRGCATSGTGVTMSPFSNLADHMIELINVVCGRFKREGDAVANPLPIGPARPVHAEVTRLPRWWEEGEKTRTGGYGMLFTEEGGEFPSAAMPDEILKPGEGQIKALFSVGGNPASAMPGQQKTVEAFKALELLVAIEPLMTTTARLAHYIIPPRLMYERIDIPLITWQQHRIPAPFGQYTKAIVPPPTGSDLAEEWHFFWDLARRLDKQIHYCGVDLNMSHAPSSDELLDIITTGAQVPMDEIRRYPGGKLFPLYQTVTGPRAGEVTRFDLLANDVAEELDLYRRQEQDHDFSHRMICRRMRGVHNSLIVAPEKDARRQLYNPAYLHSDDLATVGVATGDMVRITSAAGSIVAIAEADDTLLPGSVSISHSRGGLPDEDIDERQEGVCTSLLISIESEDCEKINGMPVMSAVPVRIERVKERVPV